MTPKFTYELVQHQLSRLEHDESTAGRQLKLEWFLRSREKRIEAFAKEFADTLGESWTPDYSADSIRMLDAALPRLILGRDRSSLEMQTIADGSRGLVSSQDVPRRDLSQRDRSLCFDVGVYWGEVLRRMSRRTLAWQLFTQSERNADYGAFVLTGFQGGLHCNPVRLVVNLAFGWLAGEPQIHTLAELHRIWRQKAAD